MISARNQFKKGNRIHSGRRSKCHCFFKNRWWGDNYCYYFYGSGKRILSWLLPGGTRCDKSYRSPGWYRRNEDQRKKSAGRLK